MLWTSFNALALPLPSPGLDWRSAEIKQMSLNNFLTGFVPEQATALRIRLRGFAASLTT